MQAPGADAIRQRFSAAGASVDADISIQVALGRLAAVMERQERHRRELAASIAFVPGITLPAMGAAAGVGGFTLPYTPGGAWGPVPGQTWAVQAIRVTGLATTDFLNVSRGNTTVEAGNQNALNTFTVAVAGAIANWHPGSKALLLSGNNSESLVFSGTVAGAAIVNLDVIAVVDAQLPYYLL